MFKNRNLVKFFIMAAIHVVLLGIVGGALILFAYLDTYITGIQGGQVLQGGTYEKALSISFRNANQKDQMVSVRNISFKNVDTFLPLTIVVHKNAADTTYTLVDEDLSNKKERSKVEILDSDIDSLIIKTENTSHSAIIDDLTFGSSLFQVGNLKSSFPARR